jgi:hypothetical protein
MNIFRAMSGTAVVSSLINGGYRHIPVEAVRVRELKRWLRPWIQNWPSSYIEGQYQHPKIRSWGDSGDFAKWGGAMARSVTQGLGKSRIWYRSPNNWESDVCGNTADWVLQATPADLPCQQPSEILDDVFVHGSSSWRQCKISCSCCIRGRSMME